MRTRLVCDYFIYIAVRLVVAVVQALPIETCQRIARLIALAEPPRVIGLMPGSEDCSAALGPDPDGGGPTVFAARPAAAAARRGLLLPSGQPISGRRGRQEPVEW